MANGADTQRSHKVMIVDDEPDVRKVAQMTVKRAAKKGTFLHAESAKQAMEMLREHSDTALIVLDMTMETTTSGLDVLRYLRTDLNNPYPRVIIYTAHQELVPPRDVIIKLDIDGYLPKNATTPARFYTTARSALNLYDSIVQNAHHQKVMATIRDCAQSMIGPHTL